MRNFENRQKTMWPLLAVVSLVFGMVGALQVFALQKDEKGKKFYAVTLSPDEVYAFDALDFSGDFVEFHALGGQLVVGKTEVGPTVVMIFAPGEFKLTAPSEFQSKMREAFGNYPATGKFTTVYMRIHPKDYDTLFKNAALKKIQDEAVLNKAKEVYGLKFYGSYHAGDLATFPPEKSKFMDFETDDLGQVMVEDGYWLRASRTRPYRSVYPRGFENPKKK
jgi:hypothetical protein